MTGLPPLLLASTSRHRRMLLERLRLPFEAVAPGVDEEAVKATGLQPEAVATTLARLKAERVKEARPDSVVIGSDQLVALDGEILGKPLYREAAVTQLLRLSGRRHTLFTALAVASDQGVVMHLDSTELSMRPLSREAVERYVDADLPLDCAGSYKLESLGVALFDAVRSADHTAVTGLPLIALVDILRSLGYPVP